MPLSTITDVLLNNAKNNQMIPHTSTRQHLFTIRIQHEQDTDTDQTHRRTCHHTDQLMPTYGKYSNLLPSLTVVMVELDPTAVLKSFIPASVML